MMTVSKCSKDAGTVLHGIDWKPEGDRSIRMDLLCDREKGGTFPPLKQQGGAKGGQPSIAEKPNEGHTHGAEVPLGGSTRLPRISGGERILHSQSPGGGT